MKADDKTVALGIIVVYGLLRVTSYINNVYELLLRLPGGRPVATIIIVLLPAISYSRSMSLTTTVLVGVVFFILQALWVSWTSTDTRRQMLDEERDQSRFISTNSIDLQFGNGSVVHESPSMYSADPIQRVNGLLKFPPTADVLMSLNG